MNREHLVPTSESEWLAMREIDVTSSQCAALFGVSPYMTETELWHTKVGNLVPRSVYGEHIEWGRTLEPVIAQEAASRLDISVRPFKDYVRLPQEKIGSSFDYVTEGGSHLIECKNVSGNVYKQQWTDEAAPPHIELQVQHQMLVSGIQQAYIAALVGGNKLVIFERIFDEDVGKRILARVRGFWRSIEHKAPPETDCKRDAELIIALHGYAEPGKEMAVGRGDVLHILSEEWRDLELRLKPLVARRKELKAKILEQIGDVERINGEGWTLSASMVGPKMVPSYERKGYRNFKLTWRKP